MTSRPWPRWVIQRMSSTVRELDILTKRDLQRSALNDVGKCYRNVFLRIWNMSWNRRKDIPGPVLKKIDASPTRNPGSTQNSDPTQPTARLGVVVKWREHHVRVVRVLRYETGFGFTGLLSQLERVVCVLKLYLSCPACSKVIWGEAVLGHSQRTTTSVRGLSY